MRVYHTDYPTCVNRTQWGANDLHVFDQYDLGDLANCDETGKADGYLWVYDAASGKWVPKAIGTAVDHGALAGLADDDHTQYLKEKASGGLAAEIPIHDHSEAAEAGTVDHGDLDGLADNDHTQYQLTSEKGAANGYMGLDASQVGTDAPQAHKDRHDPEDGADPLDTGAPSDIGSANAAGSAHALARQDHVHDIAGQAGEGHIVILPSSYSAINQGTWAWVQSAAHLFNAYWNNTSAADADEIDYKVYLAKGTYTLAVLGGDGPSLGIIDIDIDGVEVASFDLYDAGWTVFQMDTQASISIAAAGLKTLTLRVDGKNGSSSGYNTLINCIALWRTA